MLYVGLALAYGFLVVDALLLCEVIDRVGHNHHDDDHMYNQDGSLRESGMEDDL